MCSDTDRYTVYNTDVYRIRIAVWIFLDDLFSPLFQYWTWTVCLFKFLFWTHQWAEFNFPLLIILAVSTLELITSWQSLHKYTQCVLPTCSANSSSVGTDSDRSHFCFIWFSLRLSPALTADRSTADYCCWMELRLTHTQATGCLSQDSFFKSILVI